MGRTTPSKDVPPKDFESAMAELEAIVARMEDGELSLESSLAAYRRGMVLAAYCRKTLNEAEQQVKVLEDGVFADFQTDNEPGDDPQR